MRRHVPRSARITPRSLMDVHAIYDRHGRTIVERASLETNRDVRVLHLAGEGFVRSHQQSRDETTGKKTLDQWKVDGIAARILYECGDVDNTGCRARDYDGNGRNYVKPCVVERVDLTSDWQGADSILVRDDVVMLVSNRYLFDAQLPPGKVRFGWTDTLRALWHVSTYVPNLKTVVMRGVETNEEERASLHEFNTLSSGVVVEYDGMVDFAEARASRPAALLTKVPMSTPAFGSKATIGVVSETAVYQYKAIFTGDGRFAVDVAGHANQGSYTIKDGHLVEFSFAGYSVRWTEQGYEGRVWNPTSGRMCIVTYGKRERVMLLKVEGE